MGEPPDIVNLREISDRLGVAYITVQKWWRRERGSEPLPEPLKLQGGRNPIWEWSTIKQWCYDTGRGALVERAEHEGYL